MRCQKGFKMIFTEWKLRKKAPWHCGPSDLLTATRRIADNVTKTFLTLLMQWQSLSLLLTATSLWAICMTADRVVWPQVSWWQSSFVSAAAQLYPGLPLFCRWASTFPGYLSTFPMRGFLQRQVLLDVRESSRSMVLGCSPPLSSPNPAEAGKGTHHHDYYLRMSCIHTTPSTLLSFCWYDAIWYETRWSIMRAKDSWMLNISSNPAEAEKGTHHPHMACIHTAAVQHYLPMSHSSHCSFYLKI